MSTYEANLRGMNFRPLVAQSIVMELEEGNELLLEREPNNPHDFNAIKVLDPTTGEHLGYVAREVSRDLAPELDSGMIGVCRCLVPGGKATLIEIETSSP